MIFLKPILILCIFAQAGTLSQSEIKIFFGDKNCIAGSLNTLNQDHTVSEEVLLKPVLSEIDFVENIIGQANEAKSSMSSINELAQYNDISYSYELINEEGPPHSKTFTITLYLGDEHFTRDGKSLKKAQQDAASTALKNTKYEHPPIKIKENAKALTPTVLLNNLASKLGLAVTYTVVNDILEELENHNDEIDIHQRKSYLQKLNETVHSNDTIRIRKDGSEPKGPFKVRVDVNGNKFIGEAHTIKNAKHEAALKALKALREQKDSFYCLKEGDNCKSKKQSVKSTISLVYESAQQRNLGVIFEIIDEVGPSHKKLFTTKCTVGDLEATGQGKSKKESKRAAAENILPQLLEIPKVEGTRKNMESSNSKKSKKKNKKNKVIKTNFDKIDRMLDNVADFGQGLIDKINGKENMDNTDKKRPKNTGNKNRRSPSNEIMELGKILQLNIQYNDFEENDKSYSVLDLGTKPSFICLGEGVSKKNSRDLAAKHGIDVLYKLGLLDNLLDKTMKIGNILDKEEAFQNFWLEVVESKDENQV